MKLIALSIIGASVLIAGAIMFGGKGDTNTVSPLVNNVTVSGEKQIVEVTARGGYSPRSTVAKADMPTTLRMKTNGTYDCSATLTIPSINYEGNLPASGMTDIDIPPQIAGTKLQGICSMGMQSFEIAFN